MRALCKTFSRSAPLRLCFMLSEHAHQVEKAVSCDRLPGGRKFLQYLHPASQAFQSLNGTAQASPYYYKILNLHLPLTGLSHYTPDCLCYPYPYMHRLEGLRACIPTVAPQVLQAITTSLDLCKWQSELQGNPDPTYTELITQGIQYGFRIASTIDFKT